MQKFKRIAAMIGVIILVGMYVITLVLALFGSPDTQKLLMASIVCTVVVPVLLYAMMLIARVLNHSGADEDPASSDQDKTSDANTKNSKMTKK